MTATSIKQYVITTRWSIRTGPTILRKKGRGITIISPFLTCFPNRQLIMYIIIELEVEEDEQY